MTESRSIAPARHYLASRRTDVGRSRIRNEDAALATAWPASAAEGTCAVLAVADGMGGAEGGEVASHLAIDAVSSIVSARRAAGRLRVDTDWFEAYRAVFAAAAGSMRASADEDSTLKGMGTTLTSIAMSWNRIVVAHVGDSRAYLYRNRELRRLTTDHNMAQELAAEGRIPYEEMATHRSRNVLTRWLGPDITELEPEYGALAAQAGDLVVVCSDGLHTMLPDTRLAAMLESAEPWNQEVLDVLADRLIDAANDAGGNDNIAVALGLHL